MGFSSILNYAHQLIEQRIRLGETVIDATVGNGNDTLFLGKLVGPEGKVYGFDIQQQALERTRERLEKELLSCSPSIALLHRSHDELLEVLPEKEQGTIAAVMFNLGYLPGADHATKTRIESTVPALEASLQALRIGGILTIVLYPGHEGGLAEAEGVNGWASGLSQTSYQVLSYQFLNQKNNPPFLIAVEKS